MYVHQLLWTYLILDFTKSILKQTKIRPKLGFIRKFRPKRFHKIQNKNKYVDKK
jgi:hypothetical protein